LEKYLKNAAHLLIFFLLFGCSKQPLKLTGNLSEAAFIQDSGNLQEILVEKNIFPENVMLIGNDGVAVYLSQNSLEFIELEYKNSQWNSVATGLPEVANIKNLKEICLFLPNAKYSLSVHEEHFSYQISHFAAKFNEFKIAGKSSKNGHFAKKLIWNEPFSLENQKNLTLADFYFSANGDTIRTIHYEKNN
jgi:hypothetical protein